MDKISKIKDQKNTFKNVEKKIIDISEIDNLSFEDCLKKVELLSDELESGTLVLDDALQKYKLAVVVMDRASALLNSAKDDLQVIDNNGERLLSKQEILNK